MLAQLQQTFPKIDEEIILKIFEGFQENVEEANNKNKLLLPYFNSTNVKQQQQLVQLHKNFGLQLEKTVISQTWNNCNQIYGDTMAKLREICATSDPNDNKIKMINGRLKEENEIKILKEMYLHILWNILKYPKHIKYRQIHKQALYNYLSQKCHTLGADFEKISVNVEAWLQVIEFKKGYDDNWYYQYDRIQLLHLWNCYRYWINQQIMYVLIKQMI
ncbi:hypothetical protein RFI_29224 [Reticulomyxa filosa]|uniref:CUE domain-containing protein n=1 Tax=Reticulomyxa filosa TaxID=46433 RepID=X6M555_RETFI|nr:hypothetical protein RFI_29224 [Reticulomyxa filosa]|eukprot:ETO08165.1 hypothetical protein RFI_29224 [Reticulomyxa filosa]